MKRIVIIGGGAAGFFSALACAEANPEAQVTILEKSPKLLYKVGISGGGRCNVTHHCFNARDLVAFYPRGSKELIGPFSRFNPQHTVQWFAQRGVTLKTEADGRMFPVTDNSQTIIDCFLREASRLGVQIRTQVGVDSIQPHENNTLKIITSRNEVVVADCVIVTTGSALRMWQILETLGHTVVPPVPSLFTFNIRDEKLKDLPGVSVENVSVKVNGVNGLKASGPLLVTHWGLSGPAILRLSAWGARQLAVMNYQFSLSVNWTGTCSHQEVLEDLLAQKHHHPKRQVSAHPLYGLPRRLWEKLVNAAQNYADLSNAQLQQLATIISGTTFQVSGKSTNKDEFVTAGGVALSEVDFKTMQSKKVASLYFAGEVLDIDAITGGFNFQAAWTTGWIAGNAAGGQNG